MPDNPEPVQAGGWVLTDGGWVLAPEPPAPKISKAKATARKATR